MPYKNPEDRRANERKRRATPEYKAKRREYARKWLETHRDKHREYCKRYKKRHPEKRAATEKRRYLKNRDRILARFREYAKERRLLVKTLFSNKCVLCNGTRFVQLHEKYGKRHRLDSTYYLKHKEDFVPLCCRCHKMVHSMMKVFGMAWEQIKALLVVVD